jgi:hypothetical protein
MAAAYAHVHSFPLAKRRVATSPLGAPAGSWTGAHPRAARRTMAGMNRDPDAKHLDVLSILYYVAGGLNLLGALMGVLAIGCIALLYTLPAHGPNHGPPEGAITVYLVLAVVLMIFSLAHAIVFALAGRFLAKRKNLVFCYVGAVVLFTTFSPLALALAIYTIVILQKPNVSALFAASPRVDALAPAQAI